MQVNLSTRNVKKDENRHIEQKGERELANILFDALNYVFMRSNLPYEEEVAITDLMMRSNHLLQRKDTGWDLGEAILRVRMGDVAFERKLWREDFE